MPYRIITPPAEDPILVAEASRQANASETTIFAEYIQAATRYVENMTARQLMRATLELVLDRFPCRDCGLIEIERVPAVAVVSVKYYDRDGVEQTLDPSLYHLDELSEPARLLPVHGTSWPTTREGRPNSVAVRFTAGAADRSAVPPEAKQAIKLLVSHWYENREAVVTGTISKEIEAGLSDLLWQLRWSHA